MVEPVGLTRIRARIAPCVIRAIPFVFIDIRDDIGEETILVILIDVIIHFSVTFTVVDDGEFDDRLLRRGLRQWSQMHLCNLVLNNLVIDWLLEVHGVTRARIARHA